MQHQKQTIFHAANKNFLCCCVKEKFRHSFVLPKKYSVREINNFTKRYIFDGDETKYEIWEIKFLAYLHTLGLKDTILGKNLSGDETDTERNEEAYNELIQFLDDKSLSLIMREASDNGREILRILCDHYTGK